MPCCPPGTIELKPYVLNGKSYCNCTGITVTPVSQGTTVTEQDIYKRVQDITDAEVLRRATKSIQEMSAKVRQEIEENEKGISPGQAYVIQNPGIPKVILLGTGFLMIVLVLSNMKG